MSFICIVDCVESQLQIPDGIQLHFRNTFANYLRLRHDMLMYEHTFIFANKHLTPTEIAMQLESGVKTAIYFCEMTFFLLMDALGLKGTIVTPQRSTSSFRFEDQDTSKCTLSDIICVVAANQVFALERQCQVHMKKSCPLMDFWRRRDENQPTTDDDYMYLNRNKVVGINSQGTIVTHLKFHLLQ